MGYTMKRYIFSLILLATVAFNSCENDFDAKIYGVLYPENYPSTESEYESFALICYVPFGSTWQYYLGEGYNTHPVYTYEGGVIRVFDATTDEMAPWAAKGWGGEWKRLSQADYTSCRYYTRSNSSGDNLNHIPKLAHVTRLTQIIGTLRDADPRIFVTEGKREQLIGEVHLCRAMLMYFIYHLYGPMPMITDPALVDSDAAQKNLVRPTMAEMAQWIYDDMETAIENLPETVSEPGRYTADYARFCLMKHCLNEGSYMDGWYDRGLELYEDLNTGKYGLLTEGDNPFMQVFSYFNKWNKEIIMAVSNSTEGGTSYAQGNFFPYLMSFIPADVSPVDNQGNQTALWKTGWAQYYNVAPAFYDKYAADDIRRAAVLDNYWVKVDGGLPTKQVTAANIGVSWDGFLIMKWPYETDTSYQGHDFPLARWADVLLMMAELEVRKTGAAPSAEAVECVNAVRRRAGIPELGADETGSATAFLNAILDERGREFLYEGMRKIDLIRFNAYAQKTYPVKGFVPTHQYMPLPDYLVEQASTFGKTLEQTYSRPDWEADLAAATKEH